MNLTEIKEAVRSGKNVKWASEIYDVKLQTLDSGEEFWLIACSSNNHSIGLTWADDVTLNGREDQFYITE